MNGYLSAFGVPFGKPLSRISGSLVFPVRVPGANGRLAISFPKLLLVIVSIIGHLH